MVVIRKLLKIELLGGQNKQQPFEMHSVHDTKKLGKSKPKKKINKNTEHMQML